MEKTHWTQLSFKQYFNKNYFIHFFYNYVMVLVFGNYELQLCTHFTVCLLFFLYFMEYILNLVIWWMMLISSLGSSVEECQWDSAGPMFLGIHSQLQPSSTHGAKLCKVTCHQGLPTCQTLKNPNTHFQRQEGSHFP